MLEVEIPYSQKIGKKRKQNKQKIWEQGKLDSLWLEQNSSDLMALKDQINMEN